MFIKKSGNFPDFLFKKNVDKGNLKKIAYFNPNE